MGHENRFGSNQYLCFFFYLLLGFSQSWKVILKLWFPSKAFSKAGACEKSLGKWIDNSCESREIKMSKYTLGIYANIYDLFKLHN